LTLAKPRKELCRFRAPFYKSAQRTIQSFFSSW
jgi:hypothetical protein